MLIGYFINEFDSGLLKKKNVVLNSDASGSFFFSYLVGLELSARFYSAIYGLTTGGTCHDFKRFDSVEKIFRRSSSGQRSD